jgi:serine/threonine-protein kinase RsbW
VYYIGLAGREILVNAIMHGNRFELDKKIELRLSHQGNGFVIEVLDEGSGFRLEDVPDPRAPENLERHSGRGVMIALGVMDEFFAEKNSPSGMHIRMVKHMNKRNPSG